MRRNVHALIVCFLALIFTLPTFASAEGVQTGAEVAKPDAYNIVALGDSISVGYQKGMTETSVPYGYVDRVYEQALFHGRATLNNFAILGLTTPGLNALLLGAEAGKKLTADDLQDFSGYSDKRIKTQAETVAAIAPSVAPALANADLVVLTVGGNDFKGIVGNVLLDSPGVSADSLHKQFDETMNIYTANLDTAVHQIHKMAPGARIVVADQYLPLWEEHPLYGELSKSVEKLTAALEQYATKVVAEGIPLAIARVGEKFHNNVAKFTYVDKIIIVYDNHPRTAGYEAMAQAFADVIWQQYLVPAPKPAGVTLSVVVNGKELAYKPINVKNTNFLPIRELAGAVDAEFKWDQPTKTAIFKKNGHQVTVTIGAKTMIVDGVRTPLDTPAFFHKVGKETKTYVPIAAITKALEFEVIYRQTLQTAFINS
ncbi:stalk domain-containing protein [Cohnella sp. GCM10027633]|uniref:stalk domain-containing protein n=1 Tax=unclassified Cohnella TaxID=2636738 RepID=UPI003643B9F0